MRQRLTIESGDLSRIYYEVAQIIFAIRGGVSVNSFCRRARRREPESATLQASSLLI